MGDVLGAYGLAGLVLGWLFFRRWNVTLIVWGAVLTALMALLAAVSLLALPFVGDQGIVVSALSATGKRSLSTYLAQPVLCAPILAAWGLGLAAHMSSWTMFLYAIAVWLVTVAVAYALERANRRGPAEVLLRGLTYRRATRTPTVVPGEASDGSAAGEHQEHTTP